MPDALTVENLRAGYGEAVVLPSLSLSLRAGEGLDEPPPPQAPSETSVASATMRASAAALR